MARISDFEIAEAEDRLLADVVRALAGAGVVDRDSTTSEAEWDTMSGLGVNVRLADGRSATIMVQVD